MIEYLPSTYEMRSWVYMEVEAGGPGVKDIKLSYLKSLRPA